jgi:hypothetical protein
MVASQEGKGSEFWMPARLTWRLIIGGGEDSSVNLYGHISPAAGLCS